MTKRCKRIELDDPNSLEIVRLLNANPGGMRASIIAQHVGLCRRSVLDRLQLLRDHGQAYMVDQGYHAKWIAGFKTDAFELPPEYLKVQSIFRVADRVARLVGVQA